MFALGHTYRGPNTFSESKTGQRTEINAYTMPALWSQEHCTCLVV